MTPKELRIRFDEARRIYADSTQIGASYKDLERVYEDMGKILELLDRSPKVGFKS